MHFFEKFCKIENLLLNSGCGVFIWLGSIANKWLIITKEIFNDVEYDKELDENIIVAGSHTHVTCFQS